MGGRKNIWDRDRERGRGGEGVDGLARGERRRVELGNEKGGGEEWKEKLEVEEEGCRQEWREEVWGGGKKKIGGPMLQDLHRL